MPSRTVAYTSTSLCSITIAERALPFDEGASIDRARRVYRGVQAVN